MKVKAKIKDIRVMDGRKPLVAFMLSDKRNIPDFESVKDFHDCFVSVEQNNRNDLNKYIWKVCGLIGSETDTSEIEVYQNMLRKTENYVEGIIKEQDFDKFKSCFIKEHEGWFVASLNDKCTIIDNGKRINYIRCRGYYGISMYSPEQLNRFVDIVQKEAQKHGIKTLETEQLSNLKKDWLKKWM